MLQGGVLADRIGLGKVFFVSFAIAALGALGRCFALDYWSLFIASFFMGTGVAALNANSAKLLRLWFPDTANSFAMGVYTAGMSAGAALAIYVGSHLPEIHQAWWISFVLIVIGLIAWFSVYRKHPNERRSSKPVSVLLKEVLKDKNVWAIGIVAFLVFGMTNVNGSYIVPAVTALMGDSASTSIAGDMSTINTLVTCIASMVMPVVFAKLFRNMRAPFIICLIVTGLTLAVTFFVPNGTTGTGDVVPLLTTQHDSITTHHRKHRSSGGRTKVGQHPPSPLSFPLSPLSILFWITLLLMVFALPNVMLNIAAEP